MGRARPDSWLLATLAVSVCLGLYQLSWGLPAGEHSWAVDGLEPVEVPLKPVAFAWFKGGLEWTFLRQFLDGLDSALGTPVAWVAAAASHAIQWLVSFV